ncbi:MAG TPA: prepilin peptidase [Capillimicrobium sp.]|jgi:leader peptidase (prepilin peptidase)/N-methyltransferase
MTAVAALFGALIGSFLNVVAFRLPRRESLAFPASRCTACQHPIRPWHNVPVVGWLALRGRCADCDAPIPARYPLVEAATAALYAAVVLRFGLDADLWLPLAMVTFCVPIALIDLDHRIIPNRLTAPAAVVAVAIAAIVDPSSLPERLIAAAAGGGAFLLVALAAPQGMGMGDVKLVAVLGLFLGASVAPAIFVALVAGVLVGALIMRRKGVRDGRKTAVPFGPFLVLGGLVALFAGPAMIDLYWHAV